MHGQQKFKNLQLSNVEVVSLPSDTDLLHVGSRQGIYQSPYVLPYCTKYDSLIEYKRNCV